MVIYKLLYNPVILVLGINSRVMKTYVHAEVCIGTTNGCTKHGITIQMGEH
jgi:hypothetical protein